MKTVVPEVRFWQYLLLLLLLLSLLLLFCCCCCCCCCCIVIALLHAVGWGYWYYQNILWRPPSLPNKSNWSTVVKSQSWDLNTSFFSDQPELQHSQCWQEQGQQWDICGGSLPSPLPGFHWSHPHFCTGHRDEVSSKRRNFRTTFLLLASKIFQSFVYRMQKTTFFCFLLLLKSWEKFM